MSRLGIRHPELLCRTDDSTFVLKLLQGIEVASAPPHAALPYYAGNCEQTTAFLENGYSLMALGTLIRLFGRLAPFIWVRFSSGVDRY